MDRGERVTQQERELTARLHSDGCLWEEIQRSLVKLDNSRKAAKLVMNFRVKRDFKGTEMKLGWLQTIAAALKGSSETRKPKDLVKSTLADKSSSSEGVCDEVEVVGDRVAARNRREGLCLDVPPQLSQVKYSPFAKKEVHHIAAVDKHTNEELALKYHRDEMQKEPTVVHSLSVIDSPNSSLNLIEALRSKKGTGRGDQGWNKCLRHVDRHAIGQGDERPRGRRQERSKDMKANNIRTKGDYNLRKASSGSVSCSKDNPKSSTSEMHMKAVKVKRHKVELQNHISSSSLVLWKDKDKSLSDMTEENEKKKHNSLNRSPVRESKPTVNKKDDGKEELKIKVKREGDNMRKQSLVVVTATESEVTNPRSEKNVEELKKRSSEENHRKRRSKHEKDLVSNKNQERRLHRKKKHSKMKELDQCNPEDSCSLNKSAEELNRPIQDRPIIVCNAELTKVKDEKRRSSKFFNSYSSTDSVIYRAHGERERKEREIEERKREEKYFKAKEKLKSSEPSSQRLSLTSDQKPKGREHDSARKKKKALERSSHSSFALNSLRRFSKKKSCLVGKSRVKTKEGIKGKIKLSPKNSISSLTDFERGCEEDKDRREKPKKQSLDHTSIIKEVSNDNLKKQKKKHTEEEKRELVTADSTVKSKKKDCVRETDRVYEEVSNQQNKKLDGGGSQAVCNRRPKEVKSRKDVMECEPKCRVEKSRHQADTDDRSSEEDIKIINENEKKKSCREGKNRVKTKEGIKVERIPSPKNSLSSLTDFEGRCEDENHREKSKRFTLNHKSIIKDNSNDNLKNEPKKQKKKYSEEERRESVIDANVKSKKKDCVKETDRGYEEVNNQKENKKLDGGGSQAVCNRRAKEAKSRKDILECEPKFKVEKYRHNNHSDDRSYEEDITILNENRMSSRHQKYQGKSPARRSLDAENDHTQVVELRKKHNSSVIDQGRKREILHKGSDNEGKQSINSSEPAQNCEIELKRCRELDCGMKSNVTRRTIREVKRKSGFRDPSRDNNNLAKSEQKMRDSEKSEMEDEERRRNGAEGERESRKSESHKKRCSKLRRGENVVRVEGSTRISRVTRESSSLEITSSPLESESWSDGSWECQCGCTDWKGVPTLNRPSSASSFEQLRSYSGNLTMSSDYKKNFLSNIKCVPNRIT